MILNITEIDEFILPAIVNMVEEKKKLKERVEEWQKEKKKK